MLIHALQHVVQRAVANGEPGDTRGVAQHLFRDLRRAGTLQTGPQHTREERRRQSKAAEIRDEGPAIGSGHHQRRPSRSDRRSCNRANGDASDGSLTESTQTSRPVSGERAEYSRCSSADQLVANLSNMSATNGGPTALSRNLQPSAVSSSVPSRPPAMAAKAIAIVSPDATAPNWP
jgi:hypothetical protein